MAAKIKLRRGDRCPCCGQPISTNDPQVLAAMQAYAETLGADERTCGTCPVAIGSSQPDADVVMCPYHLYRDDGMEMRIRRALCDLEVME